MQSSRPLHLDDIVFATDHQVSNRLGDEVAILELDQGSYFGLNPTGAYVWQLVHQPASVRSLLASIVMEFDVDERTAHEDLLNLLGQLHAAGLIDVRHEHAE